MTGPIRAMDPPDELPGPIQGGAAPTAAAGTTELTRLFQQHNASLVQLLRARLRSDEEAWDVAQEAYVRMLQLDRIGTISYLRTYLFRTAFNIATDRLRSGQVRRESHRDPMFDPGVEERSPDRFAVASEALHAVEAALAGLPANVRETFLLYRFGELEVVEIARRLGVSDRMVRYYVQQAMSACRAAMEGEGQ